MKVTKQFLKKHNACQSGVDWIEEQGTSDYDELFKIACDNPDYEILEYFLWYLSNKLSHVNRLKVAVYSAKKSLNNFESIYPDDKRLRLAIAATERCIHNNTETNKSAARSAALSAGAAARSAALSASRSAALSASRSAARSAWSAGAAALSARSAGAAALSARSARSAGSAGAAALSARSVTLSARSAGAVALSARSAGAAALSARSVTWSAALSARSVTWSAALSTELINILKYARSLMRR